MVQELLPLAAKKGMKIVLSRPNALLPKIKLDPDKMHDVLQNLIDNAIKYGNQDSAIDVRINSDQKNIIFSVHDNGIGIPNEQFDKIFSRFFRATNAIRNVTDGSGLGLYIAQSVIKRHGGEIWFTSKEGEGTTFLFSLPLSS
jgi:two-component system sensor histidine kinase VicK